MENPTGTQNIIIQTAEGKRLASNALKEIPLEYWGPYLSERQWATVREDYSKEGTPWQYFPHEHARSRVYKWGEDGLAGISDYGQNLCFSIALWNGRDHILKERLFGLANGEGNHGEDVKELYYYLDNVPTHYYMKYLYKYPHAAFPYEALVDENKARTKEEPEYELLDTGCFDDGAYFDVAIEYAKQDSTDIYIKITATNHGSKAAPLHIIPQLWFYNRWQYGGIHKKPTLQLTQQGTVQALHERMEDYYFYFTDANATLFTENETNVEKLFGKANDSIFVKDLFHDAIVDGKNIEEAKEKTTGTKCCAVFEHTIAAGAQKSVYLRLTTLKTDSPFAEDPEQLFTLRKHEADEFYNAVIPENLSADLKNIQRLAFAGLLWNKQYYHYDVQRWLTETDGITPFSPERLMGRNHKWKYLKNQDVMLMPDKWEYPWYAAWDSAFQCIAVGIIDPCFAKNQLILLLREWFMNPEGQIPAYEWDFSNINPPVHAFAALQVYKREKEMTGAGDVKFLKKVFQKLIINFTWWVNRTDSTGNSIFEGGFLGLDNIGVFNRNDHVPDEMILEQADGTSWVGMYALNLMEIAIEIAQTDDAFEDAATKFYEHFIIIANALNELGLWNEHDKFFYDMLVMNDGTFIPLKTRSIVGVSPLFDVAVIKKEQLDALHDFKKRIHWFRQYRKEKNLFLPNRDEDNTESSLVSLVPPDRLVNILEKLLDEDEFLAAGGIRSVSKYHLKNPYEVTIAGESHELAYEPGDSSSDMFGGNSNWRGPIWIPINYLLIGAIKKFGSFYGDSLKVAYPTRSGNMINLSQVAEELTKRLCHLFEQDETGNRPVYEDYQEFYNRPENKDLVLFYEYYNGDTCRGLGASHQTGWSAVIVDLLR